VAQGLAFGAGLGVVPVSDLAAVAQRALALQPTARRVLAITDARMREVYWAEFGVAQIVEAAGAEHVSAAVDVVIPTLVEGVWLAAGRGLRASPELAQRCLAAGAVLHPDVLPRAREVLELARPAVVAGRLLPAEGALPVYVRDRVVAAAT
jgi:tRNA threonylcarbamoyladenosine biosynthesis protein TsaB